MSSPSRGRLPSRPAVHPRPAGAELRPVTTWRRPTRRPTTETHETTETETRRRRPTAPAEDGRRRRTDHGVSSRRGAAIAAARGRARACRPRRVRLPGGADSPLVPAAGGASPGRVAASSRLLVAAFVAYLLGLATCSGARLPGIACRRRAAPRDPARAACRAAAPLDGRVDVLVVRWIASGATATPTPIRRRSSRQPARPTTWAAPGSTRHRVRAGLHARSPSRSPASPATPTRLPPGRIKALAAAAALAAALLAGAPRAATRRSRSRSSAGTRCWRSMLAGGGHNDAWVGALDPGGARASAARQPQAARACSGSSRSRSSGCRSSSSRLRALESRATGRCRVARGFAAAAALVAALATWRYGLAWPLAAFRLARGNAALETSYAIPHRLEQLGLPDGVALALAIAAFVVGFVALARGAPRAARSSVSPPASCSRRRPSSRSGTWRGPFRSPRPRRTGSARSAVSRSAPTCCRRRSCLRHAAPRYRRLVSTMTPSSARRHASAGPPAAARTRAAHSRARPRRRGSSAGSVSTATQRASREHREAEHAPAFGEVRAEGVRGADTAASGGTRRDTRAAARSCSVTM